MNGSSIKGLLKADLRRGFFSWGFYAAILLSFISLLISFFSNDNYYDSFFYAYSQNFRSVFSYTAPIIAILPFNGIYHDESKSGFIRFVILRTSRRKYIFSKIFSSMLTSFSAMFTGTALFGLFCRFLPATLSPFGIQTDAENYSLWEKLEVNGGFFLALFISCLMLGLFSAVWSIAGLATSAMVSSKFFSFVLPFMIFSLLGYISREFWHISNDVGAFVYRMTPQFISSPSYGDIRQLLLALLADAVYAAIFILLFSHLVKKRGIYDV